MNILVTGGAGFIGGHLVRRLVKERVGRVAVLDNFHRGRMENLAECAGEVSLIHGDIRDPEVLQKALRDIDVVYHLAAQSSVISADVDADYTFSTNVTGTFQVLQAAKAMGVRRVVFASSREVYGDAPCVPVPETAPLKPKNLYGATKAAGEALCGAFGGPDLETVVVRLANVYGPGDRDRVLPIFIERALGGEPLVLYGGQQVVDFIWIDTVVDAFVKVGLGDFVSEPLNIGSGKGTTISNLSRRVLGLTGWRSTVKIVPARQVEVTQFVAEVTLARQTIGLEPAADPLHGLAQMLDCARRQRGFGEAMPALVASA